VQLESGDNFQWMAGLGVRFQLKPDDSSRVVAGKDVATFAELSFAPSLPLTVVLSRGCLRCDHARGCSGRDCLFPTSELGFCVALR
jgi:hypothetical protein